MEEGLDSGCIVVTKIVKLKYFCHVIHLHTSGLLPLRLILVAIKKGKYTIFLLLLWICFECNTERKMAMLLMEIPPCYNFIEDSYTIVKEIRIFLS